MTASRLTTLITIAVLGVSGVWRTCAGAETPFATAFIDYSPAPGQFVNNAEFNAPERALGAPVGAGINYGNLDSVVTLGGFGGSITLAFDHTIEDDPRNPFGMDAIVFGNAFWASWGDPELHWAECATIEIAFDVNGNSLADDSWYLIAGSHITDPAAQFTTQLWDDDPGTDIPPDKLSWIPLWWVPPDYAWPWTTTGYLLPSDIFGNLVVENPSATEGVEGIFGYADYTPTLLRGDMDADDNVDDPAATPESFYTVPDDPFIVGITPGSGGGDAFDIAWAIDVATGLPAELPGFDFIRLTNGVNAVVIVGEKSPEIDAVADVAPDPFGDHDGDGDVDLLDFAALQRCFHSTFATGDPCSRVDRDGDDTVDLDDFGLFAERMTGPR